MAKSWNDVRSGRSTNEVEVDLAKQEFRKELRAFKLRELREQAQVTQTDLAEELRVSQNMVSKFERGDLEKAQLETLARYIEALGGQLRLEADFGQVSYRLR